ncbi:hypothetical protein PV797_00725 [Clostridiaceae bacterium M8S5]|nr:hypothetical protein PV797_00725 [Clostridiaceae bacterium M8S5]
MLILEIVENQKERTSTWKFTKKDSSSRVKPQEHWGKAQRQKLIDRGIDINEGRYDEPMTRAEGMALNNKTLDKVE